MSAYFFVCYNLQINFSFSFSTIHFARYLTDVPDVLINVSQAHLMKILEMLASRDKWRQMEVVVSKARSNDVPCGQFGKNMSIFALIADKSLCGAETQRVQVCILFVMCTDMKKCL